MMRSLVGLRESSIKIIGIHEQRCIKDLTLHSVIQRSMSRPRKPVLPTKFASSNGTWIFYGEYAFDGQTPREKAIDIVLASERSWSQSTVALAGVSAHSHYSSNFFKTDITSFSKHFFKWISDSGRAQYLVKCGPCFSTKDKSSEVQRLLCKCSPDIVWLEGVIQVSLVSVPRLFSWIHKFHSTLSSTLTLSSTSTVN